MLGSGRINVVGLSSSVVRVPLSVVGLSLSVVRVQLYCGVVID